MLRTSRTVPCTLLVALAFFAYIHSYGQMPVVSFEHSTSTHGDVESLKKSVGTNKKIPAGEQQILTALTYFPELSDTYIKFRFRHRKVSFTARPTVLSVFRNKRKRHYLITISDRSTSVLQPVIFKNLPLDAQIGAVGHELSHLTDFRNRNFFAMISVVAGHLSRRYLDRFEFHTDSICIAHGLGFQLMAWSKFIRTTMHSANWTGSGNMGRGPMTRERYMNPDTIYKRIKENGMYANVLMRD